MRVAQLLYTILAVCCWVSHGGVPLSEIEALRDLFFSTGGNESSGWRVSTGWSEFEDPATDLSTLNPCVGWNGVVCSSSHVSELLLSYNRLKGSIPASVINLTQLEILELNYNSLTSTIPQFASNPPYLRVLEGVMNVDLGGEVPSELGLLTSMSTFFFYQNSFTGTIPTELCAFSAIDQFFIPYNHLTGSIPECLYSLTTLEQLDLGGNNITGSISDGLCDLTLLNYLQIYENRLESTIPECIGSLTGLEMLGMGENKLKGSM